MWPWAGIQRGSRHLLSSLTTQNDGFASWPPQLDLEITICIEIFSDWDVKHAKDRASVFLREFKKNDRYSDSQELCHLEEATQSH